MEREWKEGVYMKTNGKLVLLLINKNKNCPRYENYFLYEGRTKKIRPIIKAMFPTIKFRKVDIFSSMTGVGWGPTNYMNKAEYLGEL